MSIQIKRGTIRSERFRQYLSSYIDNSEYGHNFDKNNVAACPKGKLSVVDDQLGSPTNAVI